MKVFMVGFLGSVKARVQGPIACRNSPSGNVEGSFNDASLQVWLVLIDFGRVISMQRAPNGATAYDSFYLNAQTLLRLT